MKKIVSAILLAFAISFFMPVHPAQAYFMSGAQERQVGNVVIEEFEKIHNTWDDPYVDKIAEELVKYNPDALNFDDGKHDRFLCYPKIMTGGVSMASETPGGQVYMHKELLDLVFSIPFDGKIHYKDQAPQDGTNLYHRAMLGAVMSHEFSHWHNDDFRRKIHAFYSDEELRDIVGQNMQFSSDGVYRLMMNIATSKEVHMKNADVSMDNERKADLMGQKLLSHTQFMSPGSMVGFLRRMELNEAQESNNSSYSFEVNYNPHPETAERIQNAKKYLADLSHDRVTFKGDSFYLDGKPFMGTGKMQGRVDVAAEDRTYFLAGQIARAINEGTFHKGMVKLIPVSGSQKDFKDATDCYMAFQTRAGKLFVADLLRLKKGEAAAIYAHEKRANWSDDAKFFMTFADSLS